MLLIIPAVGRNCWPELVLASVKLRGMKPAQGRELGVMLAMLLMEAWRANRGRGRNDRRRQYLIPVAAYSGACRPGIPM